MPTPTSSESVPILSLADLAEFSLQELHDFLHLVEATSNGGVLGTMDAIITTIMTSIE